ncbi:Putative ribonuclease III domain-containing protein [Colletotrichum destructivum]|uniref:Ribonuclease III domain-containing protein n=1 Tax=Colletotrichum destructivum TaxID=34406 RepID=A0AAX4IGE3_9PEZI|nr:Putative ribonuclease III domain-containing protein [Colletotrichum destructivum]
MNSAQDTKLAIAMAIIGYQFVDTNWLWESLQAAGSPAQEIGIRYVKEGNKILAIYGDRLLGQFVAHEGILQNTMQRSREIDDRIKYCVNNERLARIFDEVGLVSCINQNPSQGIHLGPRTKSATIEAIIGAVAMDGGLQAAREVAQHLGVYTPQETEH